MLFSIFPRTEGYGRTAATEDEADGTTGVAGTVGVTADTLRRLGGGRSMVYLGCGYGSMAPWA